MRKFCENSVRYPVLNQSPGTQRIQVKNEPQFCCAFFLTLPEDTKIAQKITQKIWPLFNLNFFQFRAIFTLKNYALLGYIHPKVAVAKGLQPLVSLP